MFKKFVVVMLAIVLVLIPMGAAQAANESYEWADMTEWYESHRYMLEETETLQHQPLDTWHAPFDVQPLSAGASSASFANAPYFHGVISITVPVGTTVNLRSGMFRTQAHDVVDGCLTRNIVWPANTTITSATTVTYSVTNSRGQTATQQVPIRFEGSEFIILRRIFSNPQADSIAGEVAGMPRGRQQCAQHLGIYMPPNSNFRARVTEGPTGVNLVLTTYTGIAGQNNNTTLNRNGTTATVSHGSGVSGHGQNITNMGRVPMIKTPLSDTGHFVVELRFTISGTGSVRGLNFFSRGDNQSQFLSAWTQDHMFSVIEGRYGTMLLPWNDRNELTGNPARSAHERMSSIDEILDFFDDSVVKFNEWTGFSINAALPMHRKIQHRFLVLPQFGGIGYAYAANDHLAFSNGTSQPSGKPISGGHTIFPYLLKSWANLHEVAHMFEGDFRNGKEFSLVEIANNILANFYQRDFVTQNWQLQWIYGNLNHSQLETRLLANRQNGLPTDFRDALFLITEFLEVTGKPHETWAAIHRLNRETAARGENLTLADLFTLAAFETSGFNMSPFLQWIGFRPSLEAIAQVQNGRMPYFLRIIVGSDARATTIRNSEQLRGTYSGVLPNAARGINANATITFEIGNMSLITGQLYRVMDGTVLVHEGVVPANGIVTVSNLPIGAYAVHAPIPTSGRYAFANTSLIVREGQTNALTIRYEYTPHTPTRSRVNTWQASNDNQRFASENLFDNNFQTIWHSRWGVGSGTTSHGEGLADIDLGAVRVVTRIELDRGGPGENIGRVRLFTHPEQGNVWPNGSRIPAHFPANVPQSDIDADFSMNGWTLINTPTITGLNTRNTVVIILPTPITTRYLRFGVTNLRTNGTADSTIVSEIRVIGPSDSTTPHTTVTANPTSVSMDAGQTRTSTITVTNGQGATTVSSANTAVATAVINGNTVTVTGVAAGTTTISVRNNNVTTNIAVTVLGPAIPVITQVGDVIVPIGSTNADVLANFVGTLNGNAIPLQVNGNINFAVAGTYNVTIAATSGGGTPLAAAVTVVPGRVYASDFGWNATLSTSGWGPILANTTIGENQLPTGNMIRLRGASGNRDFRKGIATHANSRVVFDIAGEGFTTFRGYAGIDMHRERAATVIVRVVVDGVERHRSSSITQATQSPLIEVDVTGASRVELFAEFTGTTNSGAHLSWADTMFINDGTGTPLRGDVNGDGAVNADDVVMLRSYIAAADPAAFRTANPNFRPQNADVNNDGSINSADVTLLRRHIANPIGVPF
jgi:hypothetical protein